MKKCSLLLAFCFSMVGVFQSANAISVNGETYSLDEYFKQSGLDNRKKYFQRFRDAVKVELSKCGSNCADVIKRIKEDKDSPYQRCVAGVFKASCGVINSAIESSGGSSTSVDRQQQEETAQEIKDNRSTRTCKAVRDKIQSNNVSLLKGLGACDTDALRSGEGCTQAINQYYKKMTAMAGKACGSSMDTSMIEKTMTGVCTTTNNSSASKTDFLNDVRNQEVFRSVENGNGYADSSGFEKIFGITYAEYKNIFCGALKKNASLTTKTPLNEMTSADIFERAARDLREADKKAGKTANSQRSMFLNCVSQAVKLETYESNDQGRKETKTVVGTNTSQITCRDRSLFAEGQNHDKQIEFINKYPGLVYAMDPRTGYCYSVKSVDKNLNVEFEAVEGENAPPMKVNIIKNMKDGMSWAKQFNAHICTGNGVGSGAQDVNELLNQGDGLSHR